MNPVAKLIARIVGTVVIVDLASLLVFVAFAPRWLLLDESVIGQVMRTEIIVVVALMLGQLLVMLGLVLGNRRVLVALSAPGGHVEPEDLLRLFAVPSRIAYARGALAVLFGLTTLFARPAGVDSYTQGALVLLHLTLASTATLPLYVAARAAVAKALELAPVTVSRRAVGLLVSSGHAARVRLRFLVALAAPVGLVAIGASLLVSAHARSTDRAARRADAESFAAGTLDLVEGRDDGRASAVSKGRELGLIAETTRHELVAGPNEVVVPLADVHALVRYEVATPGPATVVWAFAAFVAVGIAAFAGARIGERFSKDVAIATREIQNMGVVDVLRGSRVFREAQFQSVRRLAAAVDELGDIFREFAAAQERAIIARAGAERMRALLLATMSHDLKGPLNAILGFAALLEKSRLTDGQRESLAIIGQRGRELLYLIETVLDAARIEAGSLDLVRHEAPSADIVLAASLDARELLQGSGREVVVRSAPELPVVEADAARVVQALVSLVHVASRMADKGPIILRAESRGPSLRVAVEADVPVLTPEESAQIAEADATASVRLAGRRPMSLALGVSIARAILEAHGGSLTVTADATAPLVLVATLPSASATQTVKMQAPPEM
jgi:signal transduction histidine kinase